MTENPASVLVRRTVQMKEIVDRRYRFHGDQELRVHVEDEVTWALVKQHASAPDVLEQDHRFFPWLHRVCTVKEADYYRLRARTAVRIDSEASKDASEASGGRVLAAHGAFQPSEAEEHLIGLEAAHARVTALYEAINELDEPEREIVLRLLDGQHPPTIWREMGLPSLDAFFRRRQKAYASLQKKLLLRGIGAAATAALLRMFGWESVAVASGLTEDGPDAGSTGGGMVPPDNSGGPRTDEPSPPPSAGLGPQPRPPPASHWLQRGCLTAIGILTAGTLGVIQWGLPPGVADLPFEGVAQPNGVDPDPSSSSVLPAPRDPDPGPTPPPSSGRSLPPAFYVHAPDLLHAVAARTGIEVPYTEPSRTANSPVSGFSPDDPALGLAEAAAADSPYWCSAGVIVKPDLMLCVNSRAECQERSDSFGFPGCLPYAPSVQSGEVSLNCDCRGPVPASALRQSEWTLQCRVAVSNGTVVVGYLSENNDDTAWPSNGPVQIRTDEAHLRVRASRYSGALLALEPGTTDYQRHLVDRWSDEEPPSSFRVTAYVASGLGESKGEVLAAAEAVCAGR